MRQCLHCGTNIEHKRSDAKYCARSCKTLASSKRRIERDPDYDRRRYPKESAKRKATSKAYYWANQEQQVLYSRNYRHGNRQIRQQQQLRRNERIRASTPIPITQKEWNRLKARFRNRCAYCVSSGPLQMDHVIPLARGGRHAPSNILPACGPCNISKRDHLLTEWRLMVRGGGFSPHADNSTQEQKDRV